MKKQAASKIAMIALLSLAGLTTVAPVQAENLPRVWQPVGQKDVEGTLLQQTADIAVIKTVAGPTVRLPLRQLSDEDLRYLSHMREATAPFRTWTLTENGTSRTFTASFIRTLGVDTPLSQKFIIVVHDDGRKRGYPLRRFSDDNQAYVRQHEAVPPPASAITSEDTYKTRWEEYDPVRDKAFLNYHATKHYLFIWGNEVEPAAKNWADPQFRQMNFDYFESVWRFNEEDQHAPMPYRAAKDKYKIAVYITGTGLPRHKEGFAFGGTSIMIHPAAMLAGSSVIPHEITHTLQAYTGGFQGNLGPKIGWFWECHGNWNACQFVPSVALALEVHNDRMHYELSSSRDNYGSWPFLVCFAENPRFGPGFCFDVWTENRRTNGEATETPFQTMMRLGVERKQFTGDGIAGFGDIIGQTAAHNAFWDYTFQGTYLQTLQQFKRYEPDIGRDRVLLRPVPDRTGWYAPLYAHSPRQYGINIIDVIPKPGSRTVAVNFEGIVDETEGSDWRVTLVAMDKEGRVRYSRMQHGGLVEMALKPGETRVALAVAATPTLYRPLGGRQGYNRVSRHYPYQVSFTGCDPALKPNDALTRPNVPGASHPNGGGFVAASAHVDPTAYVAPDAMVLGRAQVTGSARIEDHAVVQDDARVTDSAIVAGYALIRQRAQVGGAARVRDYATIENEVRLTEHARALEYIRIHGNGTIQGDALIKGFGDVYTGPNAPIGGGAIMGQDSEIHADGYPKPITYGLMNEFMENGILAQVTDNHYLAAHWDFDHPRYTVLKDAFADYDGVLRNKPIFQTADNRTFLTLNGKNQYAVLEGSAIDTHRLTLDMMLRWRGGAAMQRVFTFASGDSALSFTPRNAAGKAELFLRRGTTLQRVEASLPLPVGQWSHVVVHFDEDTATITIDGREVGKGAITLHPEDIRATAGYIGCSAALRDFFTGDLDDIALYRK